MSRQRELIESDRRYDSDFATLELLLEEKPDALGTIHEAEFHHDLAAPAFLSRFTSPSRDPGEGLAYMAGTHSLDQALHLFGRPMSVTALYRSLRGVKSELEDTYTISMGYQPAKELLVHVKCNALSIMSNQMTHFVRGDQGTWLKFGNDLQSGQQRGGMAPGTQGFGAEPEGRWGTLTTKTRVLGEQVEKDGFWAGKVPTVHGNWRGFYTDLVAAIRGNKPPVIDPRLSRDGIRVVELAMQSAKEGRTVPWS